MSIYKTLRTHLKKVIGRLRGHEAVRKTIRISAEAVTARSETGHTAIHADLPPQRSEFIDNRRQFDHSYTVGSLEYPYGHSDGRGDNVSLKTIEDLDISRIDDLEEYAQEITVSQETLASWISAGILSPYEIQIAEKLIKIMREKERFRSPVHNG